MLSSCGGIMFCAIPRRVWCSPPIVAHLSHFGAVCGGWPTRGLARLFLFVLKVVGNVHFANICIACFLHVLHVLGLEIRAALPGKALAWRVSVRSRFASVALVCPLCPVDCYLVCGLYV